MVKVALVVMCLCACGDSNGGQPDAFVPQDAPTMCPAKMAPLSPGVHTLFVNYEGADLTKGQCSDSRTGCTLLITPATLTVPAFMSASASRQATMDLITGYVERSLAPYSINVVTTRPASGEYWMTLVGGDAMTIAGNAGVLSLAPAVCDAMSPNGIALEFEQQNGNAITYANSLLSDFGALLGLSVTNVTNDCMCRVGSCAANQNGLICTFGASAMTDPAHDCGRIPTQNEPMLLAGDLGCRP